MVDKNVYRAIESTKKAEREPVVLLCEDIEIVNSKRQRMVENSKKNKEIEYLGLLLTATSVGDLDRVKTIIQRLKQIIFPENPDVEIEEMPISKPILTT